jgi:cobalt-zinc-cadmium efflux system outer membrane protein
MEVAQGQIEQAELQVKLLRWETSMMARQAYYDVLLARRTRIQIEESVALNRRLVDVARRRFQAGDVAEADVLRARFEEELARQRVNPAVAKEDQARVRLTGLLGQPSLAPLELEASPPPVIAGTLEEMQNLAARRRLEIGLAFQELRLNQSKVRLAEANASPDIGVAGSFIRDSQTQFTTWQIGGYLEIPWGYNRHGEIEQARAEQEAIRARLEALRVRILQEVATAYNDYQAAQTNLLRDEQTLNPQADQVLVLAQKLYEYGKGDLTQVLVTQKTVLTQRESYIADAGQVYSTAVALEKVVGPPEGHLGRRIWRSSLRNEAPP